MKRLTDMHSLFPRRTGLLLGALVLCAFLSGSGTAEEKFDQRRSLAVADMRMAAEWMARSYKIPARVPQEMLLGGYSYAETLIALAFMGEGASLNEVLEQRRLLGGNRWREIAERLDVDAEQLPQPIREILWFGRNDGPAPVLHFLPDVRPGLSKKLVINAFEPTIPSPELRRRFRLSDSEARDIRTVLDDPLGVPEEMLRRTAGPGLITADWVLAGAVAYHKPYAMEALLAARVGEDLPWSEVALAFGFRPDVLTQGPLSGVYPLLTGMAPNTILCARRRTEFPRQMPLKYDLQRLTPGERRALAPLLYHTYMANPAEIALLNDLNYELGECGLLLALTRMSELEIDQLVKHRRDGETWQQLIRRFSIDMTGHDELLAAIEAREGEL